MKRNPKPITIIGSGIAGCFLAILLAKKGHKVNIYERVSKKKLLINSANKSFNLTFSKYAVKAFEQADIWLQVKAISTLQKGSITYIGQEPKPVVCDFMDGSLPYYSIQRDKLLSILFDKASADPKIKFHFLTSLISVDKYAKTLIIRDEKTNKYSTIQTQAIFGADGVHSLIRSFIQQNQPGIHTQILSDWEYKQITLCKGLADSLKLNQPRAYSWSRRETALLAFPNFDGSLSAMLILPRYSKDNFASLRSPIRIKQFIKKYFPALTPAINTITNDIINNKTGKFITINTSSWHYKGFMALVGDSAHGFLPFFGQGISAAFADCIELVRLMELHDNNWEKIFPIYQQKRKPQTDILAMLSYKGFQRYIRDKKADYEVIFEKIESVLHRLFPKFIHPSIFELVLHDPSKSADSWKKHNQQRKYAKIFGFSVIVFFITTAISVYGFIRRSKKYFPQLSSIF